MYALAKDRNSKNDFAEIENVYDKLSNHLAAVDVIPEIDIPDKYLLISKRRNKELDELINAKQLCLVRDDGDYREVVATFRSQLGRLFTEFIQRCETFLTTHGEAADLGNEAGHLLKNALQRLFKEGDEDLVRESFKVRKNTFGESWERTLSNPRKDKSNVANAVRRAALRSQATEELRRRLTSPEIC